MLDLFLKHVGQIHLLCSLQLCGVKLVIDLADVSEVSLDLHWCKRSEFGPERLNGLSKVTHQVRGRARKRLRTAHSQSRSLTPEP